MDLPPTDPLHENSSSATTWSTVNFSEAMPGVPTPLGWTFWHTGLDAATCRAFVLLGALPRNMTLDGAPTHRRLTAIFHGHVAGSVCFMEGVAAAMPGTSPSALDEQLFGAARQGVDDARELRRYPVVAARLPVALCSISRRTRTERAGVDAWWRSSISAPVSDPHALLKEAQTRFGAVMVLHAMTSMLAQGAFDQVARLAASIGRPDLGLALLGGFGDVEEGRVTDDLWAVSRDRLTLGALLDRHGFNGPGAGELSSLAWREDPQPLRQLLATYRSIGHEASPEARAQRTQLARRDAETELRAALGRLGKRRADVVLAAARNFLPLREVGKTAFVQTLDVARHAARALGRQLVADGRAIEPDDAFYLTLAELTSGNLPDVREVVAFRRSRRAEYLLVTIPEMFAGTPQAFPAATEPAMGAGEVLVGMGVGAPVIVEGRVRLILDPADADEPLAAGEILVASATDPSWAAMFATAAALIIDVGGAISHGAIVARELGIPCAINTRVGTRVLRTGDHVRVDGITGRVELLSTR